MPYLEIGDLNTIIGRLKARLWIEAAVTWPSDKETQTHWIAKRLFWKMERVETSTVNSIEQQQACATLVNEIPKHYITDGKPFAELEAERQKFRKKVYATGHIMYSIWRMHLFCKESTGVNDGIKLAEDFIEKSEHCTGYKLELPTDLKRTWMNWRSVSHFAAAHLELCGAAVELKHTDSTEQKLEPPTSHYRFLCIAQTYQEFGLKFTMPRSGGKTLLSEKDSLLPPTVPMIYPEYSPPMFRDWEIERLQNYGYSLKENLPSEPHGQR